MQSLSWCFFDDLGEHPELGGVPVQRQPGPARAGALVRCRAPGGQPQPYRDRRERVVGEPAGRRARRAPGEGVHRGPARAVRLRGAAGHQRDRGVLHAFGVRGAGQPTGGAQHRDRGAQRALDRPAAAVGPGEGGHRPHQRQPSAFAQQVGEPRRVAVQHLASAVAAEVVGAGLGHPRPLPQRGDQGRARLVGERSGERVVQQVGVGQRVGPAGDDPVAQPGGGGGEGLGAEEFGGAGGTRGFLGGLVGVGGGEGEQQSVVRPGGGRLLGAATHPGAGDRAGGAGFLAGDGRAVVDGAVAARVAPAFLDALPGHGVRSGRGAGSRAGPGRAAAHAAGDAGGDQRDRAGGAAAGEVGADAAAGWVVGLAADPAADGLQQAAGDLAGGGGLADGGGAADRSGDRLVHRELRHAGADAERVRRWYPLHADERAAVAEGLGRVGQGQPGGQVQRVHRGADEVGQRQGGGGVGGAAAPGGVKDRAHPGQVAEDGGPAALLQDHGVAAGPVGEVAQRAAAGREQGGAQFAVDGAAAAEHGEPGDDGVGLGRGRVGGQFREAPDHAVGGPVVVAEDGDGADLLGPPVTDRPERIGAGPQQSAAEGAQLAQPRLVHGGRAVPPHQPPHGRLHSLWTESSRPAVAPSEDMVPLARRVIRREDAIVVRKIL